MKKFIIITLIFLLILTAGIIYLNKVILPVKIKSLIVSVLKEQTKKDVTLKSLEFNLLKGLILRDLVISDSQNVILSTRQANCSVFIWPIFKKQIIIPSLNLVAPYIFLERRIDQSFNLQDFFPVTAASKKKSDFNLSILKINIINGNVVFQDNTLATKFRKELKKIQLNLNLALPASLKFNLKGQMPHNSLDVFISASGEYKILSKELRSNIQIKNLAPVEFSAYYNNLGDLKSGLINLKAQINLKDQILHANVAAAGDDLVFEKDKLKGEFDIGLEVKVEYNLENKKVIFDGICNLSEADISGIELLGQINDLHGKFSFNQRSLIADGLKAQLLGMPFEIKLRIKDFATPILSIDTDLDLSILPVIAKEKFNFSLINQASGKGVLSIKAYPDKNGVWVMQGNFGITEATLKLDKLNDAIEDIAAVVEFSQQGFNWINTKFNYQGIDYQSNGTFSDFSAPGVKLKLFSKDLSLAADFDQAGKKTKINQLKGEYLDSLFLISGDIDSSDPSGLKVDLGGEINFELSNLTKILAEKYPPIKTMKPGGQLDTQFNLEGNLSDFKNCYLKVKLASNNFSLYGLKTQSLSLDFLQDQKIAKIAAIYLGLYDGKIQGSAALNLDTSSLPYQLELFAEGIKLEKLKNDTVSKSKNISGILNGEVKLNGFWSDLNKLSGGGSFFIKEGRLWDLNLLQGVGKILFAKDLGNIELSECTCEFLIKDKFIATDKLQLKGNVANLYGPLKIGFDGSLDGELSVDILSENVPLSGTLKDLATAIIGVSGKFGVIKLSGSLVEPKYNFKPAVTNIIKGLTDVIFGKQQ